MIVDRRPIPPEIRRRWERVIRYIDIIVYLTVLGGGVWAITATPNSVVDELVGWEWVIGLWSGLLLVGGFAGFTGRLSRWWMIEVPGTVLSMFGILIYFIVLGRFSLASVTSAVAVCLVAVAMLLMVRRYAELQIFASEPNTDLKTRLAEIARRRTANFVRRHR